MRASHSPVNPQPTPAAVLASRRNWIVIAITISAIVFLSVAWEFAPLVSYVLYPKPNFVALEAKGNTLIAAIEDYHSAHASYPTSLASAGITRPMTRWGRWRYRTPSSSTYSLSVGNYQWHGFTLSYTPEHGWYRDT